MKLYQTIQGDTWDMIAKKMYGNENCMDLLMSANFHLLDYFVFPAGIKVLVPELIKKEQYAIPEWRK